MTVAKFDPRTHKYSYGGRILPSVTEVLRGVGLYNDYSFAGDIHRFRGSAVHEACAKIGAGMDGVVVRAPEGAGRELRQVADDCNNGYLPAFRAFLKATGYDAYFWEQSFIHPDLGYGGTIDSMGQAMREILMPDIKTGEVPPMVPVQLAGYDILLREGISISGEVAMYGVKFPIKKKALLLEKTGKWTLSEQTPKGRKYDDPYWEVIFRSALNVWNCRTEYGLTGLGYGVSE